jgi:hypothetical protein
VSTGSLDEGKIAKMYRYIFYAASGMTFQNHRQIPASVFRVKIAASEPLKRITRRMFRISKYFHRSKNKVHVLI